MLTLMLMIGLIFSPLAAAMAYLITYEEYRHHGFGQRELIARSLQMAGFTLVVFLVVAVVLGWWLDHSA
jgi:ABC-type spermidine/putrescine transport system permease subunit I